MILGLSGGKEAPCFRISTVKEAFLAPVFVQACGGVTAGGGTDICAVSSPKESTLERSMGRAKFHGSVFLLSIQSQEGQPFTAGTLGSKSISVKPQSHPP